MRLIAMAKWEDADGLDRIELITDDFNGHPLYFETVEDIYKEVANNIVIVWLDLDTLETGDFVK